VGWAEGVHFEDFQRCLDTFIDAFNERRSFEMEYRLRRADGEYRWILDRGAPRYDLDGRFRGYIGSCVDITDRRNAARALAESEQRLRAVLDTASDAILSLDADGKIVSANPAVVRLFGVEERELVGQPLTVLLDGLPGPTEAAWRSLRSRARPSCELTGVRSDGSTLPVEIALGAAGDRFTAILRDISDRRQLETRILESREQVQRQIGQDLHDGVGQLLTGVAFLAKGLASAGPRADAAQLSRLVDLINEAIEQVRLVAKGLLPMHLDDRSLRRMLEELAQQTNQLTGVKCSLEIDPDADDADAQTKVHLVMIAREAIANAIKHGAAHRIVLRVTRVGDRQVLSVEDDGPGFRQPSPPSGLGLHTMQYRARVIGGSLDVLSGESGGTCVRCTWPDR
jgi:PAS domain S-box-containing protein